MFVKTLEILGEGLSFRNYIFFVTHIKYLANVTNCKDEFLRFATGLKALYNPFFLLVVIRKNEYSLNEIKI